MVLSYHTAAMADHGRDIVIFLFSFFFICTLKDIVTTSNAEVNNKEIPLTTLGSTKIVGPTLKILYCYSCGYRNAFERYSELLTKKYPEMVVEGGNYPPTGMRSWMARLLTVVKMLLILAIMTTTDIGRYLGRPSPSWWLWCISNKIYSCIMIFLVCNMLEGQLVSTGAFEISFNDVPVWSKLDTGRIPNPPELFQIIESHLQFPTHDQSLHVKPMINY